MSSTTYITSASIRNKDYSTIVYGNVGMVLYADMPIKVDTWAMGGAVCE